MDGASAPVLLIRHGQTEWNLMRRWQGRAESALTDLGRAQAARAAEHLATMTAGPAPSDVAPSSPAPSDAAPFDEVWSSPLQRARDTAEIIAHRLGIAEVHIDERLIETDVGAWEGLTLAELEHGWPGYLASRRHPEGFEPDAEVIARISAACLDRLDAGRRVVAVCHSGVMRTLRRHLGVTDHRIGNLGGYWVARGRQHPLRVGEIFSFLSPDLDDAGPHHAGPRGAEGDPRTDSL